MLRYDRNAWPAYEQRGRWQLYEKSGGWVAIGPPMPRAEAEARVALRRQELGTIGFQRRQPHVVPL